ncbi:hypothetical protein [Pararhodobacter aggregans]|nr:hypothetical protein [Pararhodobacter aggregans]PTX02041.1 hypothetical protein C8N33_106260 [Pararhodobacter aggregans]
MPNPLPAIVADPVARRRWIAWRARLRERRQRNFPFRTCRGVA